MRNTAVSVDISISENNDNKKNDSISKDSLKTTDYNKLQTVEFEKFTEPTLFEEYLTEYNKYINKSNNSFTIEEEKIVFDKESGLWKFIKKSET